MNSRKSLGMLLTIGTMSWGGISGLKMTPAGPYMPGSVITLTWTVSVDTPEIFIGVYFSPTGTAPWDSLAGLSKTATSYSWTVPDSPSKTAKIWLYNAEPAYPRSTNPNTTNFIISLHTQVSSTFTIAAPASILTQNKGSQFSIRQSDKALAVDPGGVEFRNAIVEISSLNGTVMRVDKFHGASS